MSRKGKKAIDISDKVEVNQKDGIVYVKGPKGELSTSIRSGYELETVDGKLFVRNKASEKNSDAYHGLYQSLVANMVEGVTNGYKIELELFGVGYKVQTKGTGLQFYLGYSHDIEIAPPDGVSLIAEGQTGVVISGIDKQKVGQMAADIIALKDARKDPYKAKGIKYKGATIRKKVGKKVK